MRDLTGQRFGRLVALAPHRSRGGLRWRCRCDCGAEKYIATRSLTSGAQVSCGCYQREVARKLGLERGCAHLAAARKHRMAFRRCSERWN